MEMGRTPLMITNRIALSSAALLAGWLLVPGCSSDHDPGEEGATGTAQAAVTNVPADGTVACIAITATGGWSDTYSFDVTPGQSSVFSLTGLPIGTVRFDGAAFATSCSQVSSSSAPTWVSAPVLTSIQVGQTAMVMLDMHPASAATVGVDFDGDQDCRGEGLPCFVDAECCSQSCGPNNACEPSPASCPPGQVLCGSTCADLLGDPQNCGACGLVCPFGATCSFGACSVSICGDGVVQGTEACDDGNVTGGDGCTATCFVEPGFSCFGQPSLCVNVNVCGDGIVGPGEQCDDGNTISGDGCTSACTLEGPSCVNGIVDGTESDVDCGGPACPTCAVSKHCFSNADCSSGACIAGFCAAPSCIDGVKNGTETDVDCGGACLPCASGHACNANADCFSSICLGGACQ
ncbi:Multiple EGF-like-domain protein 3 precursor [Minicystis rosea]|nr:Multiple EGF-like-domain protein 3 precursor [Minicystis rosea]